MKVFTFTVDASFCFDIEATDEVEAKAIARRALRLNDPVDDYGGLCSAFHAPWIAVAGRDSGVPSLAVTDVHEV